MSEKREKINTAISLLAFLVAAIALYMQFTDSNESLNYEIGIERISNDQYDDYIRIYNLSKVDVYLEYVALKADMGEGRFREVLLLEPQDPTKLAPGKYKEFRFRFNNQTDQDKIAMNSESYKTYTGKSYVSIETTRGTKLIFESSYHPYYLDKIYRSSASIKREKKEATIIQ